MWPFKKRNDKLVVIGEDEIDDYKITRWEKFWWPIRRHLSDFYWEIRWTPRNIARLISYLPVIWQDRDYDHCFVLYLLRHKLRRMEKRWRTSPKGMWCYVGQEQDHYWIKKCLIILDRLIESNYICEETDAAGIPDFKFNKIWKDKWGDKFRTAADAAWKREEADWHAFWHILEHQLRKWWD